MTENACHTTAFVATLRSNPTFDLLLNLEHRESEKCCSGCYDANLISSAFRRWQSPFKCGSFVITAD